MTTRPAPPPMPLQLQQALDAHRAGQIAQAEALYRGFLHSQPRDVDALHLLGLLLEESGRRDEGLACLQQAVAAGPQFPLPHVTLGEAYRSRGQRAEAEACYRQAIELDPRCAEAFGRIGLLFQDQRRFDDALRAYHIALAIEPRDFVAAYNAGLIYMTRRESSTASALLQRAVQNDPRSAPAWSQLGVSRSRLGEWLEAEAALRHAIALDPNWADAHKQLGCCYGTQGRIGAALDCFRATVRLAPQDAETYNFMGVAYNTLNQLRDAASALETAVRLNDQLGDAHANLGLTLAELGQTARAEAQLDRALQLGARGGVRVRRAILSPPIVESAAAIDTIRAQITRRLEELIAAPPRIDDPVTEIGKTLFYPAYHGRNDRDLQRLLATAVMRAAPSVNFVAPHAQRPRAPSPQHKIRVAFVSQYFHHHSIGLHYGSLIRALPRDRLHVSVVRFGPAPDSTAREISAAADETLEVRPILSEAQRAIAERQYDVLCYTDLGMDPLTYYLAFARLARMQCVLPGHPVTTGIPTIDVYLSSVGMESENAQDHYSERLVQFEHLPTTMTPPEVARPARSRAEFGLSDDVHLYACPQMPFKVHPDFDLLAGEILRGDPLGRLVLFQDPQQVWGPLLLDRVRRQIPDVADRVLMLPRFAPSEFYQLLPLLDVVLDSPHFNGGTTSLQCLSLGVPIVTWAGEFMRGRTTQGLYRALNLHDLVARTAGEYVQLALRLASDPAWRASLREQLLARRAILADTSPFVRELVEFFEKG